MTKLSEDARAASHLFRFNPRIDVTFRTPGRIHPRMAAALDELVQAGVLNLTKEKSGAYVYRVDDVKKLASTPKLSQKALRENSLPITVN